jgi:neutral ceramidase
MKEPDQMETFRAGAARVALDPPAGLPMAGFIRQSRGATGDGRFPLEAGAIVLEQDGVRTVLCGVDTPLISTPEPFVEQIAAATGADPAAVLVNVNHTHLAPPIGEPKAALLGTRSDEERAALADFARVALEKVVEVCRLAAQRLEPAGVVWGQAEADVAVNRRERTPDGTDTVLGWHPEGLVDTQVTTLQLRRPDESVIATAVAYGCHPVTTGYDMYVFSADFPGPMREVVRAATGGECLFLQASGGNVLPRFAFTDSEDEAERMGRRLAVAALQAVADRHAAPLGIVAESEGSVATITRYRRVPGALGPVALATASTTVSLPLQPHPPLAEVAAVRAEWAERLAAAEAAGDRGKAKIAYYHVEWAEKTEAALRDGSAVRAVEAQLHALRIGDGAIVTAPAETFTEIGMAVKERGPGAPTLYLGYVNGLVGYLPTAAELAFGGYEAGFGNRSTGLPSHFDGSSERILVESGVRLAESLFPEAEPWPADRGWTATGALPRLPPPAPLQRPSRNGEGAAA